MPRSDNATTASMLVSLATTTRIGCMRLGSLVGASRMRSLWFSLSPLSRPRAPSTAVIALMSSGPAPRSRSTEATDSPRLSVTVRSFQAVPPVASGMVFGSSVTFSGAIRVSKPA